MQLRRGVLSTMRILGAVRTAVESGLPTSPQDSEASTSALPGSRLWLPVVAVVTLLLCVPYYRVVIWVGDEGVLLHGADRLLQGEKLYSDFFEFLPPGGFVLTALWFNFAG